MSPPNHARCPACGAPVPRGLPTGLCPGCAVREALDPAPRDFPDPPAPLDAAPALPRSFGDYELLDEVARGGMGIVYRARQISLDRTVALKVLAHGAHAPPEQVGRFRVEAFAAARLNHPNIVAIHEVGVWDGLPFLVMDYVDGPNLAQVVRRQPLPPSRAATCVRGIAEAVEYAHRQGILHRDLKPSNVLLDASGRTRVTDFGLARRLDEGSGYTLTGQVLGSPHYIPPEQAAASLGRVGRPSDVYGLGGILFTLLTGRPPFQGDSIPETLHQVLHQEPPSPRLLNPRVPDELATICLKCLEKEPGRRYPTAQALADDLDRWLRHEPILARPASPAAKVGKWMRRKPALAGLLAALHLVFLAGLAGILWQWWRAERSALAESRHRREAEQAVRELRFQRVDILLDQRRPSQALALLAEMLRLDPSDTTAADQIVALLSQETFALPASPVLQHRGDVHSARFSPDGRLLVTASDDGTARLWDTARGEAVREWRHAEPVLDAQFSPDGRRVATASADRTARVWNVLDGQPVGPPLAHPRGVRGVRFAPDGSWLATAGDDHAVRLWRMPSGEALGVATQHKDAITELAISPKGDCLASAGRDGRVLIWSIPESRLLTTLVHPRRADGVRFSPDGERVGTAGFDGRARLWSARNGQLLATVEHPWAMNAIAFSPDGRWFATAGRDRAVRLWNAEDGSETGIVLMHGTDPFRVEFSDDSRQLLSVCGDGSVWVWDPDLGELLCQPMVHDHPVASAHFDPAGQRVACAGIVPNATVWDIRPGAIRAPPLRHAAEVNRARTSPDGRWVVTASSDRTVRVWDAATSLPASPPMLHSRAVAWAQFDPRGERILTTTYDATVAVWDWRAGRHAFPPVRHGARVDYSEFSPDGSRFLTVGQDGRTRFWDATHGLPLEPSLPHGGWAPVARFDPSGTRVVTATHGGTAQVWNVATGQPVGEPLRHSKNVFDARFSPDGRRVVTGSADMTARIWDATSGRPAGPPPLRHQGPIVRVAYSPDGARILTVSEDGTARLWNAETGEPMGRLMEHRAYLFHGAFSGDGNRIVTTSMDGTVRVWDGHTGHPRTLPFRHGDTVRFADFSPDARTVLAASAEGAARIWEIPAATRPPPAWLPELAEAVGGLRHRTGDQVDRVPEGALLDLKARLQTEAGRDAWLRWFLADRSSRTISPSSPMKVSEYVDRCLTDATPGSLRDALRWAPEDGRAWARWARLRLRQTAGIGGIPPQDVEPASRRALRLAPRDPLSWWVHAEFQQRAGNVPEAGVALQRAGDLEPTDGAFWSDWSKFLERHGSLSEALEKAHRAVQRAGEGGADHQGDLNRALRLRRRLWLRLDRPQEAQADFLRFSGIPDRDPATPARCLDLSPFYNAALHDDWHNSPTNGRGWNLRNLPRGRQVLGGVEFDVRGLIQLSSPALAKDFPDLPREVRGIPVARRCARIHFLHASVWSYDLPAGTRIGHFAATGADGLVTEIPLLHGIDSLEWHILGDDIDSLPRARTAWRGKAPNGVAVRLFVSTWVNPRPDVPVAHLGFATAGTAAGPFLVGISVEEAPPDGP